MERSNTHPPITTHVGIVLTSVLQVYVTDLNLNLEEKNFHNILETVNRRSDGTEVGIL